MSSEEVYSAERIAAIHARPDPEAQGLIEYLLRRQASFEERQNAMEARIMESEGRLAKTSRNSHRPSGSEPFRKGCSPLERPQGRLPGGQTGHAGQRPLRSKGERLLDRLWNERDAVLAFTEVREIPFTDNQAEQDIRMVKVKQKVSGSFRTFLGAQVFCRIRSIISTVRKNNGNILETLTQAVRGQPVALFPA
jgi:hypothetical protein